MAQYSFEQISELKTNNSDGPQVGFFNLSNDGQEAVVRFLVDSTKDFEILTVHDVSVDGKFRQVNCVRDAKDDISKCPLCTTGAKLSNRLYVKLLQYSRDSQGNIICEPKVWQRSLKMATTLKGYLDNYGPLSDIICKVVRHGAKGSMQTTYEVIPNLNKQIYRDDLYVKDTSAFENYSALGRIVFNKNFDELAEFVSTGKFPQRQNPNNEAVPKEQYSAQPQAQYYGAPTTPQFEQVSDEDLPWYTGSQQSNQAVGQQVAQQVPSTPTPPSPPPTQPVNPWGSQAGTQINRPVRRY